VVITVIWLASAGFVTEPTKLPPLGPTDSHVAANTLNGDIRRKRKAITNSAANGILQKLSGPDEHIAIFFILLSSRMFII
jgi:hypothetical protein